MELSVKQHDDGTWYARPYLGKNKVTGKPIRPYKRFPEASCEEEALLLAGEWIRSLEGAARLGVSLKISEVLARYIAACESQWAFNTAQSYRTCLNWVTPVIGDVDVDELRPFLVEAAYNVLLTVGGGGKPLAPASVRQVHEFLSGAFKWIVRSEIAPFNPMPSVTKPRLDQTEAVAFNMGDFTRLQKALMDIMSDGSADPANIAKRTTAMAAYLSLSTGMRVGEVCAATIADAKLDAGYIHVGATVVEPKGSKPMRQERTKGRKSRNVSLGKTARKAISNHIFWQESALNLDSKADFNRTICCDSGGGLLRPTEISRRFGVLRRELSLPEGTSFHTLRHTHATMLIANGADMRTVQERLGHANVATTLSLYAHVVPGRDQAAADAFDAMAEGVLDE